MNRRNFVKTGILAGGSSLLISPAIFSCATKSETIDQINLYLINVDVARHFSHGTWNSRQHVVCQITSGEHSGWSEVIATINNPELNVGEWGSYLAELKGKTFIDAFDYLESKYGEWDASKLEYIEVALYDAYGKIRGIPAIEMLGLHEREQVPGIFTILEKDPKEIAKKVSLARNQGLTSFIKLKLFGEEERDRKLIRLLRYETGSETFIIADPNRGYNNMTMETLAGILKKHHEAGMDGCEDPAPEMSNQDWITLQKLVNPLALIPDKPIRPSWESINTLVRGMGNIYNFHPKTTGSLTDMVQLGKKIKGWGAEIMIGDDSFVGPGADAWQQIGCGFGAKCVEALEKPQESDVFLKAVTDQSTEIRNGMVTITRLKPGFGLQVDADKLKKMADGFVEV